MSTTIDTYFADTYAATIRGNTLKHTKRALALLSEFLGTSPAVDTITEALLARFRDWLRRERKCGIDYSRMLQCGIRQIARHAGSEAVRTEIAKVGGDAPEGTLRHYFNVNVKPTGVHTNIGRAVDLLSTCLGHHARFDELDNHVLKRFESWLFTKQYASGYVATLLSAIRVIVRHHSPGKLKGSERVAPCTVSRSDPAKPAVPHNPPRGTLWHVFNERYVPEHLLGRSPITRQHYVFTLQDFDRFLERMATLEDLNDTTVAKYLAWIPRTTSKYGKPRGPRTVHNRRNWMLAFWRFCARKRLVDEWPEVPPVNQPEVIPRAWSQEDLDRLMRSCAEESGLVAGVPAADWWTALHLVLWDTGERSGALLQMRWEHLDAPRGLLEVTAEIRKGGRKPMLYPLKACTLAALERIRRPVRDLIFEFPGTISTFYGHYDRILRRAGLPTGRRNKLQKMRRSFGSHLEAAGGNATDALGHSRRSVTTKSYLDPSIVITTPANTLLFDIGSMKEGGSE